MKSSSNYSPFIDEFTAFGKGIGLPRSVSQILACLLVCEPREKTSSELQSMLSLSTGSVSSGVNMLIEMGLIEVVKLPGDRKHYYRLVADGFEKLVRRRIETFRMGERVAQTGLMLDASNERLIAIKHLYAFLAEEMKDTMERFRE
jgi:DNA-binding transcriptional regulator GbsR (MarR family)